MGRYINWDDLVGRYERIAGFEGAEEASSYYITYAEAMVDQKLGSCFTVPFSSNNMTAKNLAIEEAFLIAGNLKFEEATKKRDWLTEQYEALCAGKEVMVTDSGDILTRSDIGGAWSSTEDYHPVFGMGATVDFIVDQDQLDDEEDERG